MNLHYFITFSSRGSGVCRSLFLRTFMVMMLFITGSNGIYAGVDGERTITVDGKTRKYWLYVPASVEGKENVPVVFSLHGRYGTDDPNDPGKPLFTSLAKEKNFIVVYPQGRNAGSDQDKADYPGDDWKEGFGGTTGWEATGKENADTKFIKALVDKIQDDYKTRNASNSYISVDPKRFYLCGFSMGGMMT